MSKQHYPEGTTRKPTSVSIAPDDKLLVQGEADRLEISFSEVIHMCIGTYFNGKDSVEQLEAEAAELEKKLIDKREMIIRRKYPDEDAEFDAKRRIWSYVDIMVRTNPQFRHRAFIEDTTLKGKIERYLVDQGIVGEKIAPVRGMELVREVWQSYFNVRERRAMMPEYANTDSAQTVLNALK